MSEDLKSCPFCGVGPKVERRQYDSGGDFTYVFVVQCYCQAGPCIRSKGETGYGHRDIRTNAEAEQLAIEAWNTRHQGGHDD